MRDIGQEPRLDQELRPLLNSVFDSVSSNFTHQVISKIAARSRPARPQPIISKFAWAVTAIVALFAIWLFSNPDPATSETAKPFLFLDGLSPAVSTFLDQMDSLSSLLVLSMFAAFVLITVDAFLRKSKHAPH